MSFDPLKDPNANLDYVWDWSEWLTTGETIATVTWVIPAGITQGITNQSGTTATTWLSGGTAGQQYPVTCRITTTQGRTDDRTQVIIVLDR